MSFFKYVAIAAIAGTTIFYNNAVNATTFHAWEVTGVAWDDTLNARRWPASTSQKRAAYPNGTVLSLTGKCKGAPTLLDDIAHLPNHIQRQAVRAARWCEIWHDPNKNGAYEPGWIYMKYAKPYGE